MSYIDPSSLALGTSPSPSYASPSPSPSSPNHDLPTTSRKRARTEVSSEERKEARAHRNRIAAQNSRDRRKAQFTYLERRVHDLEEENRRLRAGIMPTAPMNTATQLSSLNLPSLASLASVAASAAAGMPMCTPEQELREQERERENEELKERIRTLERGWDAVVKALAAQGLPTGLNSTSTANTDHTASTTPTKQPPSSTAPTDTFNSFPSPAPSHSSIDVNELHVSALPSSTAFALQPSLHTRQQLDASALSDSVSHSVSVSSIEKNFTRHLARVASIEPSGLVALQRLSEAGLGHYPSPSATDDDGFGSDQDAKMEDLFREILVETAAPAAKDEVSDCAGVPEASAPACSLEQADASQTQVVGGGKAIGAEGLAVEGPLGSGLLENGLQQLESEGGSTVGGKRKREEEDQAPKSEPSMSEEEVQRMLSDIEVSMMMSNFDPSLSLPMSVDHFGTLNMSLLGFGDVPEYMDFQPVPDFGTMWASTNSTATAT